MTDRGICALRFLPRDQHQLILEEFCNEWRAAEFIKDQTRTGTLCRQIFLETGEPVHLHLRGTNFQLKVWQALLAIPAGTLMSYSSIAANLGAPKAQRAVGAALGRNPVAYLIPCHRVIQRFGIIGFYRWGRPRKQAMIGRESVPAIADRVGA